MNKSFTLIEILVVIVVIGILSAFILVGMSSITNSANIAKGQAFSNSLRNSLLMNLVSEWKLDGNGDDSWGTNTGTINGASVIQNCVKGTCYSFDEVGDYISVNDSDSLDFIENYTIEMFVYNQAGSLTYPTLFNRGPQLNNNGFFWTYTSGTNEANIVYQWCDGALAQSTSFSGVLPKDKWTHLVFVFTNADKHLNLYVNGVLNSVTRTLTTALPVDDGIINFGNYQNLNGNYYFKGYFDEIRWYKDIVSVSEIRNNYYLGLNNLIINRGIILNEFNQRLSELKYNLASE